MRQPPIQLFTELRQRQDVIPQSDLAELWAALPTMRTAELIGTWTGKLFDTGHPNNLRANPPRWHGKQFISADLALPDVCVDDDGQLFTTEEVGSLWMVEFRQEVTASLIYGSQPVLDHFKQVDDRTVLGIMNRKEDRESQIWLYFWLEREQVPFLR